LKSLKNFTLQRILDNEHLEIMLENEKELLQNVREMKKRLFEKSSEEKIQKGEKNE